MIRRTLSLVFTIAVALVAGSLAARVIEARGPNLTIDYRLIAAEGRVEVEAEIPRWPAGTAFGWAGRESHLGIEGIEVVDGKGNPSRVRVELSEGAGPGRRWHVPEGVVAPLRIRFRISPPPISDVLRGTPYRIGAVESSYVALRPEQVLLSTRGVAVASIRVRTSLPRGWEFLSPEELTRGTYRGSSGALRVPWVTGDFEVETIPSSGWRAAMHREYSPSVRESLRSAMRGVAAAVGEWLPGVERSPTLFVFGPRAADDVGVGYLRAAELAFLDVDGDHPRLRAQLARHALWAHAAERGPEEHWFAIALGEWLADRICAGSGDVGVLWNQTRTYQRRGDDMGILNVVESEYSGTYWQEAMATKAAALLDVLAEVSREALVVDVEPMARAWAAGHPWRAAVGAHFGEPVAQRIERYLAAGAFPLRRSVPIRFEPRPVDPSAQIGAEGVLRLSLAFSGNGKGRLESCGCTGVVAGGLTRRASEIAERRASRGEDYAPLVLELGDFLTHAAPSRLDPVQQAEQELYLELLASMGTDAVVLGQGEFLRGHGWFHDAATRVGLATVSANIFHAGECVAEPHRILRRGNLRVGIVGFSEPWLEERDHRTFGEVTRDLRVALDPTLLERSLTELRASADLTVLAGRLGAETLRDVLERYGDRIDVVITTDARSRQGAPVLQRGTVGGFVGRTLILFHLMADRALTLVELALQPGQVLGFEVENVVLDADVPNHPDVAERLDRFYAELAQLSRNQSGYAAKKFLSDPWVADDFVDEATCHACHPKETEQWLSTPHASAFSTLVRLGRQNNPGCVQCHVTGFGWESGYPIWSPDPAHRNVGCQACHGSGGRHLLQPEKGNIRSTPTRDVCTECHDDKHSPLFTAHFGEALSRVVHGGGPNETAGEKEDP